MARLKGTLSKRAAKFIQAPRIKQLELKSGPRKGVYNTPALRQARIRGVKPTADEQKRMRAAFNASGGPRDQFLDRVRKEASHSELRALGLTDVEIAKFRNGGSLGKKYQVHHRVPIQAGGNNGQSNLVLIKDDPDHRLITAQQNAVMRRVPDDAAFEVDLPLPPPSHLTWPQSGAHAYQKP